MLGQSDEYWTGKMIVDETDAMRYLIEEYCDKEQTLIDFMHTDVIFCEDGSIEIHVNYINLDNDKVYNQIETYKNQTYSLENIGQIIAETVRRAEHEKVKDEFCFVFHVE